MSEEANVSGLSAPVSYIPENLATLKDEPGVHVVWSPDGGCLFVGMSTKTKTRLRQHLGGDRAASILHDKVGRLLDAQLQRTASTDEIRDWLKQCTFAYMLTNEPPLAKATLMSELRPAFNEVIPNLASPTTRVAAESEWGLDDLLTRAIGGVRNFRLGTSGPDAYQGLIEKTIPLALRSALPDGYQVRGRTGTGDLADVPWIGVFPNGQASAKRGVYLVYLFARDGSSLYLSLMQGTQFVSGGGTVLRKRAQDIRDSLGNPPDFLTSIDLRSETTGPKRYEAASALAIRYDPSAIPSVDRLLADLNRFLTLLQALPESLNLELDDEPVHLVMKWSAERKPNTIEIHRQLAEARGSVWWGKSGQPGTVSLNATKLQALQAQLQSGVETHCYLYRAGEVWRTRLLSVTDDPEVVELDQLPDYYGTDDCNLFVRLNSFEEIEPTWPARHLVMVSNPDPARMPGALSNQTGPLQVFERWTPGPEDSVPAPVKKASATALGDPAPVVEPKAPLDLHWLADETLLDPAWLQELLDAVDRRPQVILAGPPGTGKTWLAKAMARFLTQDESLAYRLLQYHASYGYEEFIEGLRPQASERGITFERVNGAVLRMVEDIQEGSDQRHVLILDEMNRANLPRVFGELMYLLEYRGEPADLLYSQGFVLPERLVFIGAMNTADRSIRSLDIALRRRFEVFECPPSRAVLEKFYETHECHVPYLLDGFDRLNVRLTELLDRHHTVGHTFFMADPLTPALLRSVWTRQLLPLFEDYFFDQPAVAASLKLEEFWPDATIDHESD